MSSRRFVVEIEADAPSAAYLLGYLQARPIPLKRIVAVHKVETGTIQGIAEEVHLMRDQIETAS